MRLDEAWVSKALLHMSTVMLSTVMGLTPRWLEINWVSVPEFHSTVERRWIWTGENRFPEKRPDHKHANRIKFFMLSWVICHITFSMLPMCCTELLTCVRLLSLSLVEDYPGVPVQEEPKVM